jgi:hypothetical protein
MKLNWLFHIVKQNWSKNISFSFESKMPRTQHSRKRHSTSFTKFVARLQHTFSSKNIKSSTPLIQQQTFPPLNPIPRVSLIYSKRIFNKNY